MQLSLHSPCLCSIHGLTKKLTDDIDFHCLGTLFINTPAQVGMVSNSHVLKSGMSESDSLACGTVQSSEVKRIVLTLHFVIIHNVLSFV